MKTAIRLLTLLTLLALFLGALGITPAQAAMFTIAASGQPADLTLSGSASDWHVRATHAVGTTAADAALTNWSWPTEKETGSVTINNLPTDAVYGGSFTPTFTSSGDGDTWATSNTPSTCTVDSSSGEVNYIGVSTCTLVAHVAEGTDYLAATGDPQSFTISQADADCTITGYSEIYSDVEYTAQGECTGVQGEDLSAGLNLAETGHTDAGAYPADPWTFSDPAGNYNDLSGTVDDFIGQAAADCSSITGWSGTYDGEAHGASGTCYGLGGADLHLNVDLGPTFTDAPGGDANWSFSKENYEDQSEAVSIDIHPAEPDCSSIVSYSVPYDGESHGITGTCLGVGGEDLESYLHLHGSFTNVDDSGLANWDLSGNSNYTEPHGSVYITITRVNAACHVTGYTVTYDGDDHTASGSCQGVKDETLGGLDLNGTTHADAGAYPADPWTFSDPDGNYNNISATVDDFIDQAAANCSSIKGWSGSYDGEDHGASGTCYGLGGADLHLNVDLGPTFTDAPGGDANWSFSKENYEDQSEAVSIDIHPAEPDCSSIVSYSVPYDGESHGITGTCLGVGGEDLESYLHLHGSFTNVDDSGLANWDLSGNSNYTEPHGSVYITITRVNAACHVTGYTVTYDGDDHTASGWCDGVAGETDLPGLNLEGTKHTDTGTYPADPWTFSDPAGNYNGISATVADSIDPAAADCTSIDGWSDTYDGSAHGVGGACYGVDGIDLSASVTRGASQTDVFNGEVAWSFHNPNYQDAGGTVHIEITPAWADCTSIDGWTGTYDGLTHGVEGTCYGVGNIDLSASVTRGASQTDVFSGDVAWSFHNPNYQDASGTVYIDIAPASANCTSITGWSGAYDGKAHGASGTCYDLGGAELSLNVDLGPTFTDAPGDLADWSFSKANYEDQSDAVFIDIHPADPDCSSIADYSVPYDGESHGITGTCLGVDGEDLASYLHLYGSFTNVDDSGLADWDLSGNPNYTEPSGSVHIAITKVDAACHVTGYTVTYDGSEHTASGSCQGVKDETLGGLDLNGTTHTDIGDYHDDGWTFTDETGNYHDQAGTVDDFIYVPAAEMNLKQNTTAIASGGSYDFGSQALSSDTDVVFTIENTGTANLTFTTPIAITGVNADQFSLQAPLATSPVSASGSTTFTVRFTPASAGLKTATINIANNDSDENPYDLTMTGTGACPSAITVTSAADNGAGSLRQAIADVCAGGTITFDNDYTITLTSTLTIDRNMTLDGAGHRVIISGDKDGNGGAGPGDVRVFIINSGVTANLNNLTITKGYHVDFGAGIYNLGTLNVTSSTIANNILGHDGTGGGGIYSSGTLTVTNSTFSGNNADSASGGAILNSGTLTVTNSTFSGNSASSDGGVRNNNIATLKNVILANNTGDNCSNIGTLTDEGGNLEDGSSCGFSAATSQSNTNPLLGALGDHGGNTQTFPLLPGSPAIDAGVSATCAAAPVSGQDQRGEARDDLQCDSGAYELKYADSPTVIRPVSSATMTTLGPALLGIQRDTGFTDPGVITVTKSLTWKTQPNNAIAAYWSITPTVDTGLGLTLTLCYSPTESNGLDVNALRFWRFSGGAWHSVPGTPVTSTVGSNACATLPGVHALSVWTLATGQPTAVRLAAFTAAPGGGGVRLTWETVSELDNLGFHLYRVAEGEDGWLRLDAALIPSQAPGGAGGYVYTWLDRGVQRGTTYRYRLEAVGLSGQAHRLDETPVRFGAALWLPTVVR